MNGRAKTIMLFVLAFLLLAGAAALPLGLLKLQDDRLLDVMRVLPETGEAANMTLEDKLTILADAYAGRDSIWKNALSPDGTPVDGRGAYTAETMSDEYTQILQEEIERSGLLDISSLGMQTLDCTECTVSRYTDINTLNRSVTIVELKYERQGASPSDAIPQMATGLSSGNDPAAPESADPAIYLSVKMDFDTHKIYEFEVVYPEGVVTKFDTASAAEFYTGYLGVDLLATSDPTLYFDPNMNFGYELYTDSDEEYGIFICHVLVVSPQTRTWAEIIS